jgi:hypothetical protein
MLDRCACFSEARAVVLKLRRFYAGAERTFTAGDFPVNAAHLRMHLPLTRRCLTYFQTSKQRQPLCYRRKFSSCGTCRLLGFDPAL